MTTMVLCLVWSIRMRFYYIFVINLKVLCRLCISFYGKKFHVVSVAPKFKTNSLLKVYRMIGKLITKRLSYIWKINHLELQRQIIVSYIRCMILKMLTYHINIVLRKCISYYSMNYTQYYRWKISCIELYYFSIFELDSNTLHFILQRRITFVKSRGFDEVVNQP